MRARRNSAGFVFLSILMALVIIMILAGHYFTKDKVTQKTYVETQLDKSTDAACAVNRQTLGTAIITWTISNPGEAVTVEKMRKAAISVPRCPDHVEYIIDSQGNVYCPIHFPPPGQEPMQERRDPNRAENVVAPSQPMVPAASILERTKKQLGQ